VVGIHRSHRRNGCRGTGVSKGRVDSLKVHMSHTTSHAYSQLVSGFWFFALLPASLTQPTPPFKRSTHPPPPPPFPAHPTLSTLPALQPQRSAPSLAPPSYNPNIKPRIDIGGELAPMRAFCSLLKAFSIV